jgi:hypothetical protein
MKMLPCYVCPEHASNGSTDVQLSSHYPNVKGLSPATIADMKAKSLTVFPMKMLSCYVCAKQASNGSAEVQLSAHYPKVKGLSHATVAGIRINRGKKS